jgi:hypothetical protein
MLDDVGEIVSDETIVDRDEDSPYLGDSVKGLQLGMCVGSNVGDGVALTDAQALECGRPTVAAPPKL